MVIRWQAGTLWIRCDRQTDRLTDGLECSLSLVAAKNKYGIAVKPIHFTQFCCVLFCCGYIIALQWRHNERDGVSNHQPHDFYSTVYSRRRSKKTSKLRVTGLCEGNSPMSGEFPAQRVNNAENVSIWWRHHVFPRIGRLVLEQSQNCPSASELNLHPIATVHKKIPNQPKTNRLHSQRLFWQRSALWDLFYAKSYDHQERQSVGYSTRQK